MSSFKTVLKVMAAGAVLSGVAFAQSSVRVTVKIPYDFHVGANRLPAGEYNLTADMGSQVLKVTSRDTRHGTRAHDAASVFGRAGYPIRTRSVPRLRRAVLPGSRLGSRRGRPFVPVESR